MLMSPVGVNSNLRPDITIRDYKAKKTYLLDIKVSYDKPKNFNKNREANNLKYASLANDVHNLSRHEVFLDVINVGCLGSWDPVNDSTLKRVGLSNKEIARIATALTSCALKESYSIYLTHVTGTTYNSHVHFNTQ